MKRHIQIKPIIFYLLNIITGVPSVIFMVSYATAFGGATEFESIIQYFPYIIAANAVFFTALIFGMQFTSTDASNYHTITTTYTWNSDGEIQESVSTPEDKAEVATIWKRIGLSVLCVVGMGISHAVFVFVIPFRRMSDKTRVISLVCGIIIFVTAALYPIVYPKIKQYREDLAYGPRALTYSHSDQGFTVSGCDKTAKSINIPAKHNDEPVVGIAVGAFKDCTALTKVTIPNSVKLIHSDAFYGCNKLTNVKIGNNVTSIGDRAFYGCSSITSIIIPNAVTSIGESAFSGCSSITSITVGKNVTSIGNNAFNGCSNLTNVNIPNSVTSIGSGAFWGCHRLMSIEIPNSVESIGTGAFQACECLVIYCVAASKPNGYNSNWNSSNCPLVWDCKNNDKDGNGYAYAVINSLRYSLKGGIATVIVQPSKTSGKVEIPSSVEYKGESYGVTSIADKAFYDNSLTSVTIGNSVTSIGNSAFGYCGSLTSITIGNGVTSIGNSAFEGCKNLTSANIGNSVTSIGDKAFSNCGSLTSIEIPNSVTSISEQSFYNCVALTIYCEATNQPSGWSLNWNAVVWDCKNNDKSESGYAYAVIGGIRYGLKDGIATVIRQPSNITEAKICNSVTYNNETYSVTSIMGGAFSNRTGLTRIEIPNSVTSIEEETFRDCISLTSIDIPNSVTSIGKEAFRDCRSLTRIEIPSSVTSIEEYAFSGCKSLTSIDIPNSVTSIGTYAFYGCEKLKSITIPKSVTGIGSMAFYGCSILTIYCEATSRPNGWYHDVWGNNDWNIRGYHEYCPVVWDYKNKQ